MANQPLQADRTFTPSHNHFAELNGIKTPPPSAAPGPPVVCQSPGWLFQGQDFVRARHRHKHALALSPLQACLGHFMVLSAGQLPRTMRNLWQYLRSEVGWVQGFVHPHWNPHWAVPVGRPWSRGAAGHGFVLRAGRESTASGGCTRQEKAMASLQGIAMLLAFSRTRRFTAWGGA